MQSINNEHGSIIVFVTLMIVLLLIMVGMGLDTGQLTYTRSQGQAAVDAAALAAVSGLPESNLLGNDGPVTQRVAAFNTSNNYVKQSSNPIGSGNITYIDYNPALGQINLAGSVTAANGVRVALEQNNPHTGAAPGTGINTPIFLSPLMNLFGQSAPASTDINVSAVAVLKALPGVPIAVMNSLCGGSSHNLREAGATPSPVNSCWTTYTDTSKTVQALFDASASCSGLPANTERITIGTSIALNDNVDVGTYQQAANLFCPGGTCANAKCWIVPVIANASDCSSSNAPIVDWARICPSEVKSDKTTKYVKATVTCNQNLFRVDDNLCFSPRLVRDTKSGM